MADIPVSASRRSLLAGLAPAVAGVAAQLRPAAPGATEDGGDAPAVALFVAFDVLAGGRPELQRLLRVLAERAAGAASAGAGLTLAVGGTLFDRRFGLEPLRPRHLATPTAIEPAGMCPGPWHGDLLLRIEARAQEPAASALRDLVRHTHHLLAPRWKVNGFRSGDADAGTGRPAPPRLLDEPAWTRGGSYFEVRKLRHLVERGDAGDPAWAHRHLAYDHGIDEAGQFDMGRISCRILAAPEAWPDAPHGRWCGGGLFFALPGMRVATGLSAALGHASL